MPTNNYQVTWDPTNKKWTCIEDGAAAYDLVENSLHETIQYNQIAAPAVSAANESRLYFDSTTKTLKLSQNTGAFYDIKTQTTKGDLATFSTAPVRLPVGANTRNLEADSTQATGIKWGVAQGSPLTTKGDIWGYTTADARQAVGGNNRFLICNSTTSTGIAWFYPPYVELYRSSNFNSNSGVETSIVWNATVSDVWNMHPGSSATITVPYEGLYLIEVGTYVVNVTGDWRLRLYLSTGTSQIKQWRGYTSRPTTFFPQATFWARLPASGTFYLVVWHDTGAARTWYGNATWFRLRATWIAPYN
jgi:hypothetical protein